MKIALLGSTGSIGTNTLKVAKEFNIEVEVLVAGKNIELLQKQIDEFNPKYVVVANKKSIKKLKHKNIFFGQEGILEVLNQCKAEVVVNALVGFLGLRPTLEAIKLGKKVALANKESLVVGGKFIDISKIIPIDSEHFGIWYILKNSKLKHKKLIVTASGGAFRDTPLKKLKRVSVEDALNHPNWSMGKKITIDSATMVNKLFELIEGKWLFNTENIDAIIETKSIIHAIVNFIDGSSLLHAAYADMRLPIAYALLGKVEKSITDELDFTTIKNIEFRKIESFKYPIWEIKDLLIKNENMGVVLNGANEVAVEAFLNKRIDFLKIHQILLDAIAAFEDVKIKNIEDIFIVDKEVRVFAKSLIE